MSSWSKLMAGFYLTGSLYACLDRPANDAVLTNPASLTTRKGSSRELYLDSNALESALKSRKDFPLDTSSIRAFYRKRDYRYAWFSDAGPNEFAFSLGGLLACASDEGVKLQQSDPTELLRRYSALRGDAYGLMNAEVDLTARYFEYADRVYSGIGQDRRRDLEWYIPSGKKDVGQLLDEMLEKQSFVGPHVLNPMYEKLKATLRYYSDSLMGQQWSPVKSNRLPVCSGDTSVVLKEVRRRLFLLQDLSVSAGPSQMDSNLVAGIRRFQYRHGLRQTGCIDGEFLDALNVTPRQRIRQLIVNMERFRWLPEQPASRFVIVNIPAFKLLFYDKGSIIWKDEVVVGKEGWHTTVFSSRLSKVVFNPYWVVPNTILAEEIMEKIKAMPDYLSRNHFEVVAKRHPHRSIPLDSIDWLKTDPLKFPYELRQLPGSWNALGGFKFIIPNSYSIYLHDTPAKNLFSNPDRNFSHGCIRLAHAEELASRLLGSLSRSDFRNYKKDGYNLEVDVSPEVPVFIVYFTSWVDDQGVLNFRKDIYSHDGRLAAVLFND